MENKNTVFFTLNELCDICEKSPIKKGDLLKDGKYPVINSSRNILGYFDRSNNVADTLVITSHGAYAGYCHYLDTDFFAGSLCFPMKSKDPAKVLTKYIYYCVRNDEKIIRERYVNKSGVPYINLSALMKHRIPVPTIEIQAKIVELLDNLEIDINNLKTELLNEIKIRQDMFRCLKEEALSFGDDVSSVKLSDLFSFRNGLSKGKDYFGHGDPIVRYTDVYRSNRITKEMLTDLVECDEKELRALKVNRGDVLFTRTSETVEEVGICSVMIDQMDKCVFSGFLLKGTPITNLLWPEYCAYCFSTKQVRDYIVSHTPFTTRASLTGKILSGLSIKVPNISVQKQISESLYKFELATKEIVESLKKEIEARELQMACSLSYFFKELKA